MWTIFKKIEQIGAEMLLVLWNRRSDRPCDAIPNQHGSRHPSLSHLLKSGICSVCDKQEVAMPLVTHLISTFDQSCTSRFNTASRRYLWCFLHHVLCWEWYMSIIGRLRPTTLCHNHPILVTTRLYLLLE